MPAENCPPNRGNSNFSSVNRDKRTPQAFSRMMGALFTVALTQAREHAPAREYMERKLAEGKTWREGIRCLKRQLAAVVYRSMLADDIIEGLTT